MDIKNTAALIVAVFLFAFGHWTLLVSLISFLRYCLAIILLVFDYEWQMPLDLFRLRHCAQMVMSGLDAAPRCLCLAWMLRRRDYLTISLPKLSDFLNNLSNLTQIDKNVYI